MDILDQVKRIQKELHDIPECSGLEVKTKSKIKEFLETNTRLQVIEYHGGIVAFYDSGDSSPAIAFRADFDAVSLPDGSAAHLCGHDGHTAALLGVAMLLEKIQPDRNVLLIFQPAEEIGTGAKAMADVPDEYNVSEIYGCHNLPGFPFGKIYTTCSTFSCASCGLIFTITGEPAHAAYPETGKSPMRAVTELFQAIDESQSSDRFEKGTFATLIGCNIGQKAFGTSAEKAEVWITVRSRTPKDFRKINEYLEYVVKHACEATGCTYQLTTQDEFPATVNDPECAEKVLKKCDGSLLKEPMRWSEDFGHFLNHSKHTVGAFFGIGAGQWPDLHTKDYHYPENLLEHQMKAFIDLLS